jgi:HEPN domain-containing protein
VAIFDEREFDRWVRAAADEEAAATALLEAGIANSAVLHAEQAAQLLLKGLLRGAGRADRARSSHSLHGLADACVEYAGLRLEPRLRDDLMALSREYQPSRYPDAVGSGTPRENYSRSHAERSIGVVATTRAAVHAAWESLLAAGEQAQDSDITEGPP